MASTVNNVIRIPTNLDDFFVIWLKFLTPFHALTSRELDVAAAILKYRFELTKKINDDELIDKILLNEDSKRMIRLQQKLSINHFQGIIAKLKKNNIIIDNKLNLKFIPNLTNDNNFKLLLLFEYENK